MVIQLQGMSTLYPLPTIDNKMHDADKLIGVAVSRDVKEVVNALPLEYISSSAPDDKPRILGYYTSQLISQDYETRYATAPLPSSDYVVRTGARDAARIITSYLNMVPHSLSFEQALKIAQNPETLHTIALAAMRPSEGDNGLSSLIAGHSPSIIPTPDYTAITAVPSLLPRADGCPEAGDQNTLEVKPTPLFVRFSEWAGELALRSLHYADQTKHTTVIT